MIAHDIIVRPIITEKSMLGAVNKVYTFEVAKSANKIEIAKACEEVFKVKVAKVNTVSVRGRFRRQGRPNRISNVPPEPLAGRKIGPRKRF